MIKLNPKRRKKMKVFDYVLYAMMGIFALITVYPFIYVVFCSFSDGIDFSRGGIWLFPRVWSLSNYIVVFNDARLYSAFGISIARTVLGTAVSLGFTSMVAYGMQRKELRYRSVLYWINIFTMFFGGGLIPYFLTIVELKLYDTFLVYIIPGMYSVYNMIVISSFFRSIPEELHEAAVLDGAGEFYIFSRIYIPLSGPVFATVGMWIAVGHWGSYWDTMMYTTSDHLMTLQYYLTRIVLQSQIPPANSSVPGYIYEQISPRTISFAAITLASIPVLCIYPLIMKNFNSGITVGSLKG